MSDTFDVGDRRTFSREVSGEPYRVDFLLRKPDGTEIVYATTASAGVYSTVQLPTFEDSGTYTGRWNSYAAQGDDEPVESDEFEFEVHATAFATPFGVP